MSPSFKWKPLKITKSSGEFGKQILSSSELIRVYDLIQWETCSSQSVSRWIDSGCQWPPCILASKLTDNMLRHIVKMARLLSSDPGLFPLSAMTAIAMDKTTIVDLSHEPKKLLNKILLISLHVKKLVNDTCMSDSSQLRFKTKSQPVQGSRLVTTSERESEGEK